MKLKEKNYIQMLRSYVGHSPLIMVTAGAIIYKDEHILLQQRKDNQMWAIHGGALELGESLEEALYREVKEETNLEVTGYELFKTYSGQSFMITYPNKDVVYLVDHIYVVKAFHGLMKPCMDEVLTLKWFHQDDLPWDMLMPHNQIVLKDFLKK